MESNYISKPSNFEQMENSSVDFTKTFDLNGTDNDEMLRLYLRKAGLSDQIECLTPEQRRAFIYDIIKSNKLPGYWVPSTMKTSAFSLAPPAVRPPPPPPGRTPSSSPSSEQKTIPTIHYATISSSSSSSSLQSLNKGSPVLPHRFIATPPTPPSPSTFVTNSKGSRYEISGPMNFQHISGDMTRDMTRNAFDLSTAMNDNVLKKYMIERGITDEDLRGMKKKDIICNIVQSKFTWQPSKRQETVEIYSTISSRDSFHSARSSASSVFSEAAPIPVESSDQNFSNFTFVASRFADPSEFPTPDSLFGNKPEGEQIPLPPLPPHVRRPSPPPRKVHCGRPKPTTLPLSQNSNVMMHSKVTKRPQPKCDDNLYEIIQSTPDVIEVRNEIYDHSSADPIPPPPPLPPPAQLPYPTPIPQTHSTSPTPPPPPPPPSPPLMDVRSHCSAEVIRPPTTPTSPGDARDALLESIRQGVTLKKCPPKFNHGAATNSVRVKPNVPKKPPVTMDFLSELKMGITIRRARTCEDYLGGDMGTDPDESHV